MFKWKNEYSCNISEIDNQHKKLLEIGWELASIVSSRDYIDYYDEIMRVMEELKRYAIYHFKYEEDLMEKYGFEGLKVHKKEHDMFIDKIANMAKKDIDDDHKKISMDILVFIADWIENHILKTDHGYKDFLNGKGVF